jgi:alpha-L-rhamnosidase
MNHYCYGSIVEWIITYAAGIQAQSPGFSRARIAPRPNWDLHALDTTLDSAAGTWRVLWECVDERRLHVRITVPFDTTAEVILPHAPASAYKALGGHVLTSGTYEVTYDTTRSLRLKPNVKRTSDTDSKRIPYSRRRQSPRR